MALSIGRLEQKQSVSTDPATGNSVTIASMTVGNYDKGKVGSFEMKELAVAPRGAGEPAFRMADMKLAGLDLHRPLNVLSVPGWRPGMPIERIDVHQTGPASFVA